MVATSKAAKKKFNFSEALGRIFAPFGAISQQKHMAALKDGFALVIPFTIAAATSLLFTSIIFGGRGADGSSLIGLIARASGNTISISRHLFNDTVTIKMVGKFAEVAIVGQTLFNWIFEATIGSIAVIIAITMGFAISASNGEKQPAIGGVVGLTTFFVLCGKDGSYFGGAGIITAIIAGIGGGSVFSKIVQSRKLEIRMPQGVPPAVGRAFNVLFPAFITLVIFASINILISLPYIAATGKPITSPSQFFVLTNVISDVVLQPFLMFSRSGGDVALLYINLLLSSLLFFCGIHGNQTLKGAWLPISTLLWIDNLAGANHVATGNFIAAFASFGGTGTPLAGLILMMFMLEKDSQTRVVAKYALPANFFTISEPVIFGIPMMFNPIWFFPFVFSGAIGMTPAVIAVKEGWMQSPIYDTPWTMPPIIRAALISGFDWKVIVISVLCLGIQFLLWAPFVFVQKIVDKREKIFEAKQAKLAAKEGVKNE